MEMLSNNNFLLKCDLTGLTMVAWSMSQIFKKSSSAGHYLQTSKNPKYSKQNFSITFEQFMRNLEKNYLEKMKNEQLANQCLIMTIQSFNRLNELSIKNNF
jgi:hypothetical protein